jgi:vesicle-fusing ATPase
MTIIELVHSKTPPELKANVEKVKPHATKFTAFAAEHPAGLDRPMLSLDDTAVALTFLPVEESRYTYLHLRRDLANICAENGVEVASKYYNTSSHITFARFANKSDLKSKESLEAWIQKIKSVNQWLKDEYWPKEEQGKSSPGLRWIVGAGRGVEIRHGRLWYGDGKPVDFKETGKS